MSEVKKWYIGEFGGEAQARPCSPAEFEIIHASEGRYFVLAENYDSAVQCFLTAAEGCVAAERREQALQQRLTAADEALDKAADEFSLMSLEAGQRMDVLEGLLRDASAWIKHNSFHGTDAIELWERIDAALKRSKPFTCTWTEGGFSWHTGCGKEWQFTDGGLPAENGMHFCHSCGKALVVDEDQPESERES
ncbi:hypothetical protein FEM54_30025 [Pseudomonas edaphica]|uniref:Zinc ribbon domain-containing protein n=1 Tax=Pseudomonas edaphica TaxID=2006980 RepID=A0ABY2TW79_9PSED|nr:hypothetical protein [Pseudomonas edaphica]TLG87579.1 hypothetical protein FEM54_30025 [Pseudomonas edaphica]